LLAKSGVTVPTAACVNAGVASEASIELKMEPLWPQRFPQSSHLLQQEVLSWQKTSWELRLVQD
jgi:exopolyphosphatase/guanosine-5'-triphosphate,3'-diphosphate pyrophosphatase